MLRLRTEFAPRAFMVPGDTEKRATAGRALQQRGWRGPATLAGWNSALNAGLPHVTNPVNPTASNVRVFGGGVGPTRRGANIHLESESLRYSTIFGYA